MTRLRASNSMDSICIDSLTPTNNSIENKRPLTKTHKGGSGPENTEAATGGNRQLSKIKRQQDRNEEVRNVANRQNGVTRTGLPAKLACR